MWRSAVQSAVWSGQPWLVLCVLRVFRKDVFGAFSSVSSWLWFSITAISCINWKFVESLLCLNWVEILFLHNDYIVAILITAQFVLSFFDLACLEFLCYMPGYFSSGK